MSMLLDAYRYGVGTPTDPYRANRVLQLHMDDDAPFIDSSSHAHTVTKINGATVTATNALYNKSYVSDGTNGRRLEISSSLFAVAANTPWCLEFRIRPTTFADDQVIMGGPISGGFTQYLSYTNGFGALGLRFSGITHSLGTLAALTWQHVEIDLYDDGGTWTLKGFLDGVTAFTSTHASVASGWGITSMFIGTYGSNSSIDAMLDEVRFTDGVAMHTSDFTPPTPPFLDA